MAHLFLPLPHDLYTMRRPVRGTNAACCRRRKYCIIRVYLSLDVEREQSTIINTLRRESNLLITGRNDLLCRLVNLHTTIGLLCRFGNKLVSQTCGKNMRGAAVAVDEKEGG